MKCIICTHETKSFTHPKTNVLFHECPHCKVIFKDPMHHPTEVEEHKRYLEHENSINNEGYVNFLTSFIDKAIKPYIKSGYILDFGSGPEAVLAELLKKSGYQTETYDPFFDPEFNHEEKYDMITLTEVFEHVKNPLNELKFIDEHLKQGGYFSMMTLLYPEDKASFCTWFYIRDLTHIIFYHSETYRYISSLMNWSVILDDQKRMVIFKKK